MLSPIKNQSENHVKNSFLWFAGFLAVWFVLASADTARAVGCSSLTSRSACVSAPNCGWSDGSNTALDPANKKAGFIGGLNFDFTNSGVPGLFSGKVGGKADKVTAIGAAFMQDSKGEVVSISKCIDYVWPTQPILGSPQDSAVVTTTEPILSWFKDQSEAQAAAQKSTTAGNGLGGGNLDNILNDISLQLLNSKKYLFYRWYIKDAATGDKVWQRDYNSKEGDGVSNKFCLMPESVGNVWVCTHIKVPAGKLKVGKTYIWSVEASDFVNAANNAGSFGYSASRQFTVASPDSFNKGAKIKLVSNNQAANGAVIGNGSSSVVKICSLNKTKSSCAAQVNCAWSDGSNTVTDPANAQAGVISNSFNILGNDILNALHDLVNKQKNTANKNGPTVIAKNTIQPTGACVDYEWPTQPVLGVPTVFTITTTTQPLLAWFNNKGEAEAAAQPGSRYLLGNVNNIVNPYYDIQRQLWEGRKAIFYRWNIKDAATGQIVWQRGFSSSESNDSVLDNYCLMPKDKGSEWVCPYVKVPDGKLQLGKTYVWNVQAGDLVTVAQNAQGYGYSAEATFSVGPKIVKFSKNDSDGEQTMRALPLSSLPNLSFSVFSNGLAVKTPPAISGNTLVSYIIKNTGAVTLKKSFKATVSAQMADGKSVVSSNRITRRLKAGESYAVNNQSIKAPFAKVSSVFLSLDSADGMVESDESDNTVTLDLSRDIAVQPPALEERDANTTAVTVAVKNEGNAGTGSSVAKIVATLSNGKTLSFTRPLASLSAGRGTTLKLTLPVALEDIEKITVNADSNNKVNEIDEENNSASYVAPEEDDDKVESEEEAIDSTDAQADESDTVSEKLQSATKATAVLKAEHARLLEQEVELKRALDANPDSQTAREREIQTERDQIAARERELQAEQEAAAARERELKAEQEAATVRERELNAEKAREEQKTTAASQNQTYYSLPTLVPQINSGYIQYGL